MIWLVCAGGAFGAGARYLLGMLISKKSKLLLPIPTLIINITGSFLLGLLFNINRLGMIDESLFSFWGIGFCGAFTTFSTFSVEAVQLLMEERYFLAISYVLLSTLIALIGTFLGFKI